MASPPPARSVTIADVARHAGVSTSAVSFALNQRPGVSDATRERILRAARELGWEPSARARALARNRANAIGLVLARPVELLGADPFFGHFLAGVESVLADTDHALVLQVRGEQAGRPSAHERLARAGRVDGFLLTDARVDDPRFPTVARLGLPAVVVGDPGMVAPFPAVGPDESVGTLAAVDHLVALGHERIAYVSGPTGLTHADTRALAWSTAMRRAGLADRLRVEGDFTGPGGEAATRHLLAAPERPTAIVYANDLMAMAGVSVLRRAGLEVPEDLSVVGYDDVPMAAHLSPALTTVRQDPVANGAVAAALLMAAIDGGEAPPDALPTPSLVVRDSTAPPPTGAAHAT